MKIDYNSIFSILLLEDNQIESYVITQSQLYPNSQVVKGYFVFDLRDSLLIKFYMRQPCKMNEFK